MELSEKMQQLIALMKQHFKEEADITVEEISFGTVKDLVLVENEDNGKYGVLFPRNWEEENLKEGVDIEELAAGLMFVQGYRVKDLLKD